MPEAASIRYVEAHPPAAQRIRGVLVLIHAFPLNARMWEEQLDLAASGWRVLAPQLRHFDGGDEGRPPVASMDDYAADVIDLLDALHIHGAVIGGLSMGGYVTFALFRRAPGYFRAMVLADTRPQADTPEGLEGRRRMLALLREKGVSAVVDDMLPKLLSAATRRDRPDVVERVRRIGLANSPESIAGAITALMTRPDSTPLLPTVRCPTLILAGAEDAITPPALSEAMHAAIPGSKLVVIDGAAHLSNVERPAAFNDALSAFLDQFA